MSVVLLILTGVLALWPLGEMLALALAPMERNGFEDFDLREFADGAMCASADMMRPGCEAPGRSVLLVDAQWEVLKP